MLAQLFFQARLEIYIKKVSTPVFGVKHYHYRFEFDKSRGLIHFHMFAVSADNQPRRLLRYMKTAAPRRRRAPSLRELGCRYRSRPCAQNRAQMAR